MAQTSSANESFLQRDCASDGVFGAIAVVSAVLSGDLARERIRNECAADSARYSTILSTESVTAPAEIRANDGGGAIGDGALRFAAIFGAVRL